MRLRRAFNQRDLKFIMQGELFHQHFCQGYIIVDKEYFAFHRCFSLLKLT
jgi:hypothetical protein